MFAKVTRIVISFRKWIDESYERKDHDLRVLNFLKPFFLVLLYLRTNKLFSTHHIKQLKLIVTYDFKLLFYDTHSSVTFIHKSHVWKLVGGLWENDLLPFLSWSVQVCVHFTINRHVPPVLATPKHCGLTPCDLSGIPPLCPRDLCWILGSRVKASTWSLAYPG